MARHHSHPELRRVAALIEAEIRKARKAERKGEWITYLVRDPRLMDHRGNPGLPIYVGQSQEFGKRVQSRFYNCEKLATAKDSIEKRVAVLLHAGWVAPHQVLERTPTRLASLVSETNWARECVRRGYDIANLLPEQRIAGPPIGRLDIPASWLWTFTLEEAAQDAVVLELGCRACGTTLDLDLAHLRRTDEPPQHLYDVRLNGFWRREPCIACGKRGGRYVLPRVT